MSLTDEEKRYVDTLLGSPKISESDLEIAFGKEESERMRYCSKIREELARRRTEKAQHKSHIEDMKIDDILSMREQASKVFKQILDNPDHKDAFAVAKMIYSGEINYLSSKGKASGEIAGAGNTEKKSHISIEYVLPDDDE